MLEKREKNPIDENSADTNFIKEKDSLKIKFLSAYMWIFLFIVAAGAVLGIKIGGIAGFFVFLASVPTALLSALAMVIYLDFAEDIKIIKKELIRINEDIRKL